MMLFRPLSRAVTRPLSLLILVAWVVAMVTLVNRSYSHAASANLATDLARYGSAAVWRGVYYRGEKIGFTVSQTVPTDEGFELDEDGRLQMSLLGAISQATIHTTARVDKDFALRSFDFSLDPGTGPVKVSGRMNGRKLALTVTTASGTSSEERELPEAPALSQSLSRRLANGGLVPGARHQWTVFDPATLRNAPVMVAVGRREVVRGASGPMPAFRVDMEFGGLRTTSWVTDTGEVVREESPLGLITIRETADRARAMAVPGRVQSDLLDLSAVVPVMTRVKSRIDEPRDVRRLRVRLDGPDLKDLLASADVDGVGQTIVDGTIDIRDAQELQPGPPDPGASQYLTPEPLIESDAPEIRAEAERAIAGVTGTRARAERLTRHVNALLDKKPTVGLPSAREVLRTQVGDCNEHTALYVAMARSIGIPSRIAVGLVHAHGAFYYHAWPEVYLDEGGQGLWLPVDPTLNEFPADATHLRLARGGLDKQAAILPLIGRVKMTVLDLELAPNTNQVVVGKAEPRTEFGALAIPMPRRESCCACLSERRSVPRGLVELPAR